MRKVLYIAPLAALVLGGFASEVSAQEATVTYQVTAINEISGFGNPGALVINTAAKLKDGVTDASTSWAVTTNQTGMKVSAAIDGTVGMPAGVTLSVTLAKPTTGSTSNTVVLSTTAQEAVTGITTVDASALAVTYKLTATPQAGVLASATKRVLYTVTAGT